MKFQPAIKYMVILKIFLDIFHELK